MIHALPGMGADHRMYPTPWDKLPGFVTHDWPRYNGETSLSEVARRVCDEFEILDHDVVVGSSIGGMIACEVAKIRRLDGLFLIGSAVCKTEINKLLEVLHPLAEVAPIDWLQFSAGKLPAELAQMFATSDPTFVRAMCSAIFRWDGLGSVSVRCYRIHGRLDRVIPPPRGVDLFLDGGHVLSMTHAEECRQFIETRLSVG